MSKLRKRTHEEIVAMQVKMSVMPRLPFCVVVHNIRSLYNVGAIFRTADAVGIEKVWLTGFTGYPPQSGIDKSALGAQHAVPWTYEKDVVKVLKSLKQDGYELVLLEQMDGAIAHHRYEPQAKVCLILGNEVEGVDDQCAPLADKAVEISMHGIKNSLNVAVAFGIIAYHIRVGMTYARTM